jgi:hypothetical protein
MVPIVFSVTLSLTKSTIVMADLVGTCPKGLWKEWIAEGDAAGEAYSGEEWGWYTKDRLARTIRPGERFYVVAHGCLRGWAPVTRLITEGNRWIICRRGDAVACTLAAEVPGFQGLRVRWWDRKLELPFPNWREINP